MLRTYFKLTSNTFLYAYNIIQLLHNWQRELLLFIGFLTKNSNILTDINFEYNFYLKMGKQADSKKEMTGKVYRQFSRQKYNKYKAQFPNMRESQIVTKIIKEWDALDNVAKDNLQKLYEEKKYLTTEDISSSEALMRSELKKKEERRIAQKAANQATKAPVKILTTKIIAGSGPKRTKSDSDFNRGSEQIDDSRVVDSDSSRLIVQARKTKQIGKPTPTAYIKFFKYHYEQYSKQHPRWSPSQISSIIKLLWKKQKNNSKRLDSSYTKDGRPKSKRILSGRLYYKKIKGFDGKEAKYKWVRLPLETKKHYQNESKEIKSKADSKLKYTVPLKNPYQSENNPNFTYMKNKIK